jgi:Flp pilus assembly protein TadD
MKLKTLTALSLLSLLLGTSCIRRTVSQDFGIPGLTSMPRAKPQPALSPDASVRAVFQQQTQRAFNPARAIDQLKHTLAELTSTDPKTANTWNELGLRYEDVASLSDAQSAFEHAIEANPASESAHNNLGYNLLLQSRLEAAEAEFRNAIELNPASTVARNNLAMALARRGESNGALEQFLMTGDAATAHNNLAVVLLEAGQYEQSRQELVAALNIRHYFPPALANFKLVQERIREEAEVKKFGRLPLNPVRASSSLAALVETLQKSEETK